MGIISSTTYDDNDIAMILLTGHTSFIGKEVQKLPYKFHLLQNRLENIFPTDFQGINTIVHLAAVTHVHQRERERESYYQTNVEGTRKLLNACTNIRNIVFMSTIAASKECGDYGWSKLLAEQLIEKSGIPYTILRLGQVYDKEYKLNDFFCRYMKLAQLPIVPYIPNITFHPIAIERVVEEIQKAIETPKNTTLTVAGDAVSMKSLIKGVAIPIPIWTVKHLFSLACLFGYMSPDQLQRLVCKKHDTR